MSYLKNLNKKWVIWISRKDLEKVMTMITKGSLDDFIRHVTWVHERFRERIRDINLPGNTLYYKIWEIIEERDNQLQKLQFKPPKANSRCETLIREILKKVENIGKNDEMSQ